MKAILPLLFTVFVFADDGSLADRQAIEHTIARLNPLPLWNMANTALPNSIFTADATSDLDKLQRPKTISFGQPPNQSSTDGEWRPVVTVSKEPWGEAQTNLGGYDPNRKVEFLNPRISAISIRFITRDVALVEGTWRDKEDDRKQAVPLFFVMKKGQNGWKIAAAKLVSP